MLDVHKKWYSYVFDIHILNNNESISNKYKAMIPVAPFTSMV